MQNILGNKLYCLYLRKSPPKWLTTKGGNITRWNQVYSQNLESLLLRSVLEQGSASRHLGTMWLIAAVKLALPWSFFMPSCRHNLISKCILKQIGLRHSTKQKLFKTQLADHLKIQLTELGSVLWRALKTVGKTDTTNNRWARLPSCQCYFHAKKERVYIYMFVPEDALRGICHKMQKHINARTGTSLMIQWLRIHLSMQSTQVWSLIGELRSHMPWGNQRACVLQLERTCSLQRRPTTAKIIIIIKWINKHV